MQILHGDAIEQLRTLPTDSVHCVVTSPPYWGVRDYGHDGQIGLEETPDEYVARLVNVFREVRRVLRDDGTVWLNLGDSYASGEVGRHDRSNDYEGEYQRQSRQGERQKVKLRTGFSPKNLVGIPWRVAFALQADGWLLRQDIIWHKPNPMPESVRDRCTKAHEYVFLLTKSSRYFYDAAAVAEDARNETNDSPKRNRRSVWTVATQPYAEAHFATMPPKLAGTCIRAGCPVGGTVLDPFAGSGTTLAVAVANGCNAIGVELNAEYIKLIKARLHVTQLPLIV